MESAMAKNFNRIWAMRPHLIDSTKSPLIRHRILTAIMLVAKTA